MSRSSAQAPEQQSTHSASSPGAHDLDVLERLKAQIKSGTHEKFQPIPQPQALNSLLLNPISVEPPSPQRSADALASLPPKPQAAAPPVSQNAPQRPMRYDLPAPDATISAPRRASSASNGDSLTPAASTRHPHSDSPQHQYHDDRDYRDRGPSRRDSYTPASTSPTSTSIMPPPPMSGERYIPPQASYDRDYHRDSRESYTRDNREYHPSREYRDRERDRDRDSYDRGRPPPPTSVDYRYDAQHPESRREYDHRASHPPTNPTSYDRSNLPARNDPGLPPLASGGDRYYPAGEAREREARERIGHDYRRPDESNRRNDHRDRQSSSRYQSPGPSTGPPQPHPPSLDSRLGPPPLSGVPVSSPTTHTDRRSVAPAEASRPAPSAVAQRALENRERAERERQAVSGQSNLNADATNTSKSLEERLSIPHSTSLSLKERLSVPPPPSEMHSIHSTTSNEGVTSLNPGNGPARDAVVDSQKTASSSPNQVTPTKMDPEAAATTNASIAGSPSKPPATASESRLSVPPSSAGLPPPPTSVHSTPPPNRTQDDDRSYRIQDHNVRARVPPPGTGDRYAPPQYDDRRDRDARPPPGGSSYRPPPSSASYRPDYEGADSYSRDRDRGRPYSPPPGQRSASLTRSSASRYGSPPPPPSTIGAPDRRVVYDERDREYGAGVARPRVYESSGRDIRSGSGGGHQPRFRDDRAPAPDWQYDYDRQKEKDEYPARARAGPPPSAVAPVATYDRDSRYAPPSSDAYDRRYDSRPERPLSSRITDAPPLSSTSSGFAGGRRDDYGDPPRAASQYFPPEDTRYASTHSTYDSRRRPRSPSPPLVSRGSSNSYVPREDDGPPMKRARADDRGQYYPPPPPSRDGREGPNSYYPPSTARDSYASTSGGGWYDDRARPRDEYAPRAGGDSAYYGGRDPRDNRGSAYPNGGGYERGRSPAYAPRGGGSYERRY